MLCDMSHITYGKFFRFEVAKLPPQTRRSPAQRLADANPAYVCGVGLARARLDLVGPGPSHSPAWARPQRAAKPCRGGVETAGACRLTARPCFIDDVMFGKSSRVSRCKARLRARSWGAIHLRKRIIRRLIWLRRSLYELFRNPDFQFLVF
jgi:hypothetical protein